MRPLFLASLFLLACGAFAGFRTADLLPRTPRPDEPSTWTEDYRLARKSGEAFEISDGRWLVVPRLYADFDLQMDVELGEHVDLDVLVRQVEPRFVQGRIDAFHGRFGVLRLTTGDEGPAWRTREEALFGPRGVGASLAPGIVATVWIEGRGRTLRANVAGKLLPPFEVADDRGQFTLLVRGGKAALHRLAISSRGVADPWFAHRSFWVVLGAAGGALVLAAAWARGARGPVLVLLGLLLVSLGEVIARSVVPLPLAVPPPGPLAGLLGGAALLGALVAACRGTSRAPLAVAVFAAIAYFGALSWARGVLQPPATPEVDRVFGRDAGSTISEALAQIARGPFGLQGPPAPDSAVPRVVMLGGQILYGGLRPVEEHLEGIVRGELRRASAQPVDVVSLPVLDGHAAQQWELFTRFFAGHRPRVLVFGVGRDEAAIDPATGRPRSFGTTLRDTLAAARAWARANGAALVMFVEAGLPADLQDAVRAVERDGVPTVFSVDGEAPSAAGKRLASAIEPGLR